MEKEKMTAMVCAVQNGEEDAAAVLYDSFRDDLYYYILKTVNDPELAEDLLQDTFIEILQTIGSLKEPSAFVTWSRQIAYHRCTAHFRKRHELLADENEDGQTVFDTIPEDREEFIPDEALDKEDLKQTIHAMIAELPEEQRSAILLRYFDEISVKEIARIQGVSEGTVKSRLNYGRKAIKQAVESYEKKNGIKLHCAGVIPLLLWLFREYAVANGISLTSATASATYTAVPAVAEGVKAGAKAAGKFAAKKLIAGVAAVAVVTGGIAAGVLLQPEEQTMQWCGYGISSITEDRRYDLTVEEMDDTYISGHLEVSYLYEISHETDFTGTGTAGNGNVLYEITFETPAVLGTIPQFEYTQIRLEYDKETDCFVFDDFYEVTMERSDGGSKKVLAENEKWSGLGEDSFHNAVNCEKHLFELAVYKMTETEISGKLTVSYNGQTDHISEFVGRGYAEEGTLRYEIMLETPRTQKEIIEITVDRFWLLYDPQADTFTIPPQHMYCVTMEREK